MSIVKILTTFIFIYTQFVSANDLFIPHQSSRARAMGGTIISDANGLDALFFNAAALSRVEGYVFDIAKVNAGASQNSQRLLDQTKSSGSTLAASDLQNLYGETFFAEASAHSGMVIPRFGIAAYSHSYVSEVFNNPVFPTFNINLVSDYGYIVGTSIPIGLNLSFGIAGRHIKRWSGKTDILISDLIGTNDKDLVASRLQDKGSGNALDLSMHYVMPASKLNLSLSWKDVGDTKFTSLSGNGPEKQSDNLTFGVSKKDTLSFFDMTYAFEYNHIRQDDALSKKVHFGAEASLGLFDFRLGLNQGYLTYGLGVDLWLVSVDATAYTEEFSTNNSQIKSDRYQATVTLALDLDQSLKLRNQFGKKRRLMQRR